MCFRSSRSTNRHSTINLQFKDVATSLNVSNTHSFNKFIDQRQHFVVPFSIDCWNRRSKSTSSSINFHIDWCRQEICQEFWTTSFNKSNHSKATVVTFWVDFWKKKMIALEATGWSTTTSIYNKRLTPISVYLSVYLFIHSIDPFLPSMEVQIRSKKQWKI